MSVRMHISHAKTRSRRGHHRAEAPTLVKDAKSGTARMRHFADPKTGMYRGKALAKPVKKAAKKKVVKKAAKKTAKKAGKSGE